MQQQMIDEEQIYYSHLLSIVCSAFGLKPDIWEMFKGLDREFQNDRADRAAQEDIRRTQAAIRSKNHTLANRKYQ